MVPSVSLETGASGAHATKKRFGAGLGPPVSGLHLQVLLSPQIEVGAMESILLNSQHL